MAHTMVRAVSCVSQLNPPSIVALNSASAAPPADASSSSRGVVVSLAPHGIWKASSSLPCNQQQSVDPFRGLKSRPFHTGNGKLVIASPPLRLVSSSAAEKEVSGARCFSTTSASEEECTAGVPGMAKFIQSALVVMKREYGAFGGATLEKSKLEISSAQAKTSPQLEDGGGSGGIGNKNNHGGGDGGDDDGDDDDYFGEDDDGDDGDEGGFFGRRVLVPEVFDRKVLEAVLQEWYMTMSSLPAGIRQAVEMGLISTAQVVRYISVSARPTMSRALSRSLPSNVSRAFVGRLKDEWGLAAANILTISACNCAVIWCLSPSRSYGQTFRFDWQNALQKLPQHSFDMSYPLREFSKQQRVAAFFYKSLELGLIGTVVGTAGAGLARIIPHPKEMSVPLPSVSTSALSYGAFLGFSANLRYQFLYGSERLMQQNLNNIGLVIFCSTALRVLNIQLGDLSRLSWLGLNEPMYALQTEGLTKAYHRPSLSADSVARWVIPKRGVISGFFEEIFSQTKDKEPRQSQPSNIFAKRKVKRKVTIGR